MSKTKIKSKRYEIINNTKAPIVINSVNIAVRPNDGRMSKAFIFEHQIDDPDVSFLIRKGKISLVEVQEKKEPEIATEKEAFRPSGFPNQKNGSAVVMVGKVPVKKQMGSDILFEEMPKPPPPEQRPVFEPEIINTSAPLQEVDPLAGLEDDSPKIDNNTPESEKPEDRF